MKLLTYVNYAGNCKEAFQYYEKHLGGKITFMMTHGEGPVANTALPKGWSDAVLHARMTLGGTDLLGADIPNCLPTRSSYLTLFANSNEEAESVYAALSDGGEALMPIAETFFAHRFGQVRDKFGVAWMIIHERPRP